MSDTPAFPPPKRARAALPVLPAAPMSADPNGAPRNGAFSNLDDIRVASPCTARWEDMVGSDTVRFCGACQKNVYHLSGMTRDEALGLLRATEGRLCVRFFRRADGTVLTEDCPVGVARLVRRAKRATRAAYAVSIAALATLLSIVGGASLRRSCERVLGGGATTGALVPAPAPDAPTNDGSPEVPNDVPNDVPDDVPDDVDRALLGEVAGDPDTVAPQPHPSVSAL